MSPPENLYGLDVPSLAARLAPLGAKPYAARQVSAWMYRRRARAFDEMSDLSAALRSAMAERFTIETPRIASRFPSIDGTVRYLIALPGGGEVEAVAIPERGRMTFCISSQVGCALACTFCMTGTLGLTRHLSSGEIAGQVDLLMEDTGFAVNHFNIVFMGMGEPLHNYDGTVAALRVLSGSDGFAIGAKRITVSTAGLAPEIERLAGEKLRVRLALSLSATTDERARRSSRSTASIRSRACSRRAGPGPRARARRCSSSTCCSRARTTPRRTRRGSRIWRGAWRSGST